jgi:outer membrane phospholipase A
MKFFLAICCVLIFSTNSLAAEPPDNSRYFRYSTNEPNYFIFAKDNHDESHLEFNLSVKVEWGPSHWKQRMISVYNGTYDFYLAARDSSPVISRRQNVAPFVYQNTMLVDSEGVGHEFRLGWYHESNGQTIDNVTDYNNAGEFARDEVSRGWDYFGADHILKTQSWKHHLDLRFYCDCQGFGAEEREDEIFWRSINEQPHINDFDGIRWTLEDLNYLGEFANLRLELKAGNRDFSALGNISAKFVLSNVWKSPFSIIYFNGYGREVSSYHERNSYVGIGIEVKSF